jgi:hypothetical protein
MIGLVIAVVVLAVAGGGFLLAAYGRGAAAPVQPATFAAGAHRAAADAALAVADSTAPADSAAKADAAETDSSPAPALARRTVSDRTADATAPASGAATAPKPAPSAESAAQLAPPAGTERDYEAAASSELVQPAELAFDPALLERLEGALRPAASHHAKRAKSPTRS